MLDRASAFVLTFTAIAATGSPLPVGVITLGGNMRLVRAGTATELRGKAGDLLFPGDRLLTNSTGAGSFAFCPEKRSYAIEDASIKVGTSRVRITSGRVGTDGAIPFCLLPAVEPGSMGNLAFHVQDLRERSTTVDDAAVHALPAEEREQLACIDAAIAANGNDLPARIARAVLLERGARVKEAIGEYESIRRIAEGAVWTREASRRAASQLGSGASPRAVGGSTYAVIIGINTYPLLSVPEQLRYAEDDARDFYKHLTGRRGGVSKENVELLLGKGATQAAIRAALQAAFDRAKASDVVSLYVAAHGIAPDHDDGISDAYLLTYDSDPENLGVTAVRMSEIQAYMQGATAAREVRVFIDACKSGRIGSIQSKGFNRKVDRELSGSYPAQVLAFLASRSKEVSLECDNYRHGAFTYFVLRALETNEASDRSGRLTADGLSQYVTGRVHAATHEKQTPIANAALAGGLILRHDSEAAPELSFKAEAPGVCENERGRGVPAAEVASAADSAQVTSATRNEIPADPASSIALVQAMRQSLPAAKYEELVREVRVRLEEAGQHVILEYLKGEATTPPRAHSSAARNCSRQPSNSRLTTICCLRRNYSAGDGRSSFSLAIPKRSTLSRRLCDSTRPDPTLTTLLDSRICSRQITPAPRAHFLTRSGSLHTGCTRGIISLSRSVSAVNSAAPSRATIKLSPSHRVTLTSLTTAHSLCRE